MEEDPIPGWEHKVLQDAEECSVCGDVVTAGFEEEGTGDWTCEDCFRELLAEEEQ